MAKCTLKVSFMVATRQAVLLLKWDAGSVVGKNEVWRESDSSLGYVVGMDL
jgi:hypothetical protein